MTVEIILSLAAIYVVGIFIMFVALLIRSIMKIEDDSPVERMFFWPIYFFRWLWQAFLRAISRPSA